LEENAENKILNILEKVEWNYDSQSFSLYVGSGHECDNLTKISKPEELLRVLVTIVEEEFSINLPSDEKFADEQKEKFDAENMVLSYLQAYRENIKILG
jgi:hypothetical protein